MNMRVLGMESSRPKEAFGQFSSPNSARLQPVWDANPGGIGHHDLSCELH